MKRLFLLLCCALLVLCAPIWAFAEGVEQHAVILFTHDIHSHLDEYVEGKDTLGGVGRMKTVIDEAKKRNPDCLLVDGGDFAMGTLYQTLYLTDACELTMLGQLGYDATTLGNHEFDFGEVGLADMLHAAKLSEAADETLKLPYLLNCNIDWAKNTDADDITLRSAMEEYGALPWVVIERGNVKIGLLGLIGEKAVLSAPLSGITFEKIIPSAQAAVKELKAAGAELIVCLSHSGTDKNSMMSEDEQLARAVPDIDVIVSGHTHTTLTTPIVVGNTYIVSSACYGEYMGELGLSRAENGRWRAQEYKLNRLDSAVPWNTALNARLEDLRARINSEYLSHYGYTHGQPLCENTVDFGTDAEMHASNGELGIGNLIADAYIDGVRKAQGLAEDEQLIAVVGRGVIRCTLPIGTLSVNDAYNISSLGIGADNRSGYPLVCIYLKGSELYEMADIDASLSSFMKSFKMYAAGLGWRYNTRRMLLNRVIDVYTIDSKGERFAVEPDKLYRVVANLYSAQMLSAVKSKSYGLLTMMPRDENGQPVNDFSQYIVRRADGTELKEWQAVAGYLADMGTVDTRYAAPEGRVTSSDSFAPSELFTRWNKITWIVLAAALLIITAIVFAIRAIVKRRRRRAKKTGKAPEKTSEASE